LRHYPVPKLRVPDVMLGLAPMPSGLASPSGGRAAATSGRNRARGDINQRLTSCAQLFLRRVHATVGIPGPVVGAQAHGLPGSHGPSSRDTVAPHGERKVNRTDVSFAPSIQWTRGSSPRVTKGEWPIHY
jgi:hypothetical protein